MLQKPPSTEEVFETLFESMKTAFVFMKEEYIEAIVWWTMYAYIFPHSPTGPKNMVIHFENNSHKATFEYFMNSFFLPWDKGNMATYSMASTLLLKVDRTNLPQEGAYCPKLMIASIRDGWFDFPPALFICEATGQDKELRDSEFKMLKGMRNLLFLWSIGYKPIPHRDLVIPAGLGPFAFLLLVCPTKAIIQNLLSTCFNESIMFLNTLEKKKSVLPKTIGKNNMKYKKNILAHDIIYR